MPVLKLDTPPPSANKIWRNIGGRVLKSAEYRAWMSSALWQLRPQIGLDGDCYWSLIVRIPGTSTKADIGNMSKAIEDALHQSGRVPDDRYIVRSQYEFYAGDCVEITVTAEDAAIWGPIRGASKQLIKKLGG